MKPLTIGYVVNFKGTSAYLVWFYEKRMINKDNFVWRKVRSETIPVNFLKWHIGKIAKHAKVEHLGHGWSNEPHKALKSRK